MKYAFGGTRYDFFSNIYSYLIKIIKCGILSRSDIVVKEYVLWNFVLWDFVCGDSVLWDFVLWDFVLWDFVCGVLSCGILSGYHLESSFKFSVSTKIFCSFTSLLREN